MVEDFNVYERYQEEDNYGTAKKSIADQKKNPMID
jgi:hypothetical protein